MLTYDEALNFISQKKSLGIKPGLSRIKQALEILGNPQDEINIIHIAGTNGKGTVANTIARALQNNGLRVGLFTSPWVCDYREQIQINSEWVSESVFAEAVSRLMSVATELTEFELLTCAMLLIFKSYNVDYAVIECGMGGRGDATNVEKKNVCSVITSVSLDHTDFLGNTIEEIRYEKEGIIRDGCPCFRYRNTGNFNHDNLELAKEVIRFLGYDDNIELAKPVARQQRIGGLLLDGGHNPEAGKALSNILNNEVAVIGMMRDKDIEGYLSFVAPRCKKIICTNVDNPRAIDAVELSKYAEKYCNDVAVIGNPLLAVKESGVSLICGSFYLIREIINSIS